MTDSLLEDRRKALEEQFFKKQDAELLQRMREQRAEQERRQALATASGVRDEAALEAMVQADIGPETLAALGLVPLVAVAWADGKLDDDEREAVLSAARGLGLEEGGPADRLLVGWRSSRPGRPT
jgi:tellurite resistance protein